MKKIVLIILGAASIQGMDKCAPKITISYNPITECVVASNKYSVKKEIHINTLIKNLSTQNSNEYVDVQQNTSDNKSDENNFYRAATREELEDSINRFIKSIL